MSILSALAAAIWSVWTWKDEQIQARHRQRDQEAALFVNSLILTAEALQARLYAILEGDELERSRMDYPPPRETPSSAAVELLYFWGLFVGWSQLNYRYGPFIRDRKVLGLASRMTVLMDSRDYPGAAFRLTQADRLALAQACLRRASESTATAPCFEAVSIIEFEGGLTDPANPRHPLFQRVALKRCLEAYDRASRPEELEGRERLAEFQNILVDLLTFLESNRKYHLHNVPRRRARMSLQAPPAALPAPASPRVLHQTRGRLRLGVPGLERDASLARRLQEQLARVPGVQEVRVSPAAASVVVSYAPQAGVDMAGVLVGLLDSLQGAP